MCMYKAGTDFENAVQNLKDPYNYVCTVAITPSTPLYFSFGFFFNLIFFLKPEAQRKICIIIEAGAEILKL